MDGLLVKINYDFLSELENRGLSTSGIRIKFLSRDTKGLGTVYKSYDSFSAFSNDYSINTLINDKRYLCSSGEFPVIENLTINNNNLDFLNRFAWYAITGNRYHVKTISYDSARSEFYEGEVVKYLDLMNSLFDTYTKNINNSISIRLSSYVDPCYVDAGYISATV